MYLAEVKRDLGKSREASDLYRHVVGSKDKRYAKEAGALWTASLAEAVKKSEQGSKAGSSGVKPGEPSELEKQYIEAADRLQEALEDTPEAREAALRNHLRLHGSGCSSRQIPFRLRMPALPHLKLQAAQLTISRM